MKRSIFPGIVVVALVFGLFSLTPSVTSAKTKLTNSQIENKISVLEKKVSVLLAQIESLKALLNDPVVLLDELNKSKKGKPITLLEDLENSRKMGVVKPLTVISPNEGEMLKAGDVYKIVWTGGHPEARLKLSVYGEKYLHGAYGNSRYVEIARNVANTGSYEWKVPSTLPEGRYYVWVEWPSTASQRHPMNSSVVDRSDKQIVVSQGTSEDFLRSDINSDGKVDDADERILENSLGVCPVNTGAYFTSFNFCSADINGDGTVNDDDRKILENNRS